MLSSASPVGSDPRKRHASPSRVNVKRVKAAPADEALLDMEGARDLGEGTTSTVYAARCRAQLPLAVKEFKDDDGWARRNFVFEQDVLLRLRGHENIVRIVGSAFDDGQYLLLMELCELGTLDRVMRHNRDLCDQNAPLWMKQLLSGLEWIHRHGYTHCDLKPENILLRRADCIVIGDFSLSEKRKVTPAGVPEAFCPTEDGTVLYTRYQRPPEALLNQCYWDTAGTKTAGQICAPLSYGAHSDVWALGVVFAQMFDTARCLYSSRNTDDLLQLANTLSLYEPAVLASWHEARHLLAAHELAVRHFDMFDSVGRSIGQRQATAQEHVLFSGICRREPAFIHGRGTYLSQTKRMLVRSKHCAMLLWDMLSLVPGDRPTAAAALAHPFFQE